MRILLITQHERLYLPIAVDRILSALGKEMVAVVELPSFSEGVAATARRFHRLYGTGDFLKLVGRYVIAAVLDRFQRWGLGGGVSRSVSTSAHRHSVPLVRLRDINAPESLVWIHGEARPDLIISIAASQRFKATLLNLPPLGCINLHSSPLPKYRGMMPNFWAMAHGDVSTQVTVHTMVESLDAGIALVELPVDIPPGDTLHRLMARSKQVGAEAMVQAVERVREGRLEGRPLDPKAGSYFSFPSPSDVVRLKDRGYRLI